MKVKAFCLLLSIIILLNGCSTNRIVPFDVSEKNLNAADEKTKALLTLAQDTVSTNINDLLTTAYDEKDIFSSIENGTVEYADQLDNNYKIECIRQIGHDIYYAAYRTNEDNYFYIYYRFIKEEKRLVYGGFYYFYKPLFYEDFQNIKEGSSIDDVKEIDVNVNIENVKKYTVPQSIHYLADGRNLTITYKREQNGNFTVCKIEFVKTKPSVVNMIYQEDLPEIK